MGGGGAGSSVGVTSQANIGRGIWLPSFPGGGVGSVE